ncbi:carbohydrate ABC transporter membrane protein 2 (CUT1 family) [Kitasatospora sp. SolWspMP-SS2h]|uniref:carbohydrate ABC transporter permease n=1 Tax=Kitasatospora sp. SolWspMP-SS2h TaxID=1305729 RepID=UPI000DBA212B|nr:carbohydrate ABC transporter permease [Kitasatospora sp. SolWspMP-SS2h]RAJ36822.1 carbohydrate ABC transporter membrane protein 2 (CUT1 family) [Kitasatospora sp. SolWspMP-SS2h]
MTTLETPQAPAAAADPRRPAAPVPTARRVRAAAGLAGRYLLLALVFALTVGPFLWQLSTSLKGNGERVFGYPPQLLPARPTLHHYAEVLDTVPVLHYAGNSLVVALGSVLTNCLLGSMAGYALARMKFRGRGTAAGIFLATMIIPFESIMVSEFLVARSLHLTDTLLGVMIPGAASGLSVMLMRNAFRRLPAEVEEAAVLDGAGEWTRFWRIALPSVRGTLAAVAIFSFVFSWDDFLWPLVSLSDQSKYTLTVGIQYLSGTFTNDQRVIAAGTMMAVVPLLALFFALQRFFFRGVGEGAVKG